MFKKTLQVKLKNAPTDAPLVCSPASSVLNKEETPSVQNNQILACNTPEVDLLSPHTGGQNLRVSGNMYVFVLNMRGEPLMPTSCRKARMLLKSKKAVVIQRFPFTIKLTYQTGENRQKTVLGIDPGYKFIGFSCISDTKELICGTVVLDNKTSERLTERRMYRRNKRNKLRYREPRFNNRKIAKGWLSPSTERRYQTHLTIIKKLKKILFIDKVIIESGNFDIQKIHNPEITDIEYQQGNLFEYKNLKSYILTRENHKCQLCGKTDLKTDKWDLHHIIEKSNGGTDKSDNIALLHESCHKKLHKNNLKIKKNKQYKDSTFMNILKSRLIKELNCKITFGYITSLKREELKLEKSHYNDAFVIAGGRSQQIRSINYDVIQKRKNNRKLQINRKGFKPSIRRKRYKIQPKDLIKIKNKIYEVIGTHNCGKSIMYKIKNKTKKDISINRIFWYFNSKTLIFNK